MPTTRNADGSFDAFRQWPWPRFPPSAALLLFSNFLPLVGVILWEWSPFIILLLYWLENVAVGVTTALKIFLCQGGDMKERAGTGGFFALHYGIFTLVHGVFVFALGGFLGKQYYGGKIWENNWWLLGLTAISLVGSHAFDFIYDYLWEGRGRQLSPNQLMWRPYPRMLVLHVTIVLGVFLAMAIGGSWPVIALLVVLKTVVDVVLQLVLRVE